MGNDHSLFMVGLCLRWFCSDVYDPFPDQDYQSETLYYKKGRMKKYIYMFLLKEVLNAPIKK